MRLYIPSFLLFIATSQILAAPIAQRGLQEDAAVLWGKLKAVLPGASKALTPKTNAQLLAEYQKLTVGGVDPATRQAVEKLAQTSTDPMEKATAQALVKWNSDEATAAVKNVLSGAPASSEQQQIFQAVAADTTHPLNSSIKAFQDVQANGQSARFTSRQKIRQLAGDPTNPLNSVAKQTKADYLDDLTRTGKGGASPPASA